MNRPTSSLAPLERIRLARGISRRELGARAHVPPRWLAILERTPEQLTPRTAHEIACILGEVLGVAPEELLP